VTHELARSITDPDRQTDALTRLAEALAKAGQLKRAADAATLSMPAIASTGNVEITRRARASAPPAQVTTVPSAACATLVAVAPSRTYPNAAR
jgi:hypothetical protein